MRQKEGFKLRSVMGQTILVGEGLEQIDFNKIISLNSTAAELWEAMEGRDFTVADLTRYLIENYDIDKATASKDAAELAEQWITEGIVSE